MGCASQLQAKSLYKSYKKKRLQKNILHINRLMITQSKTENETRIWKSFELDIIVELLNNNNYVKTNNRVGVLSKIN